MFKVVLSQNFFLRVKPIFKTIIYMKFILLLLNSAAPKNIKLLYFNDLYSQKNEK